MWVVVTLNAKTIQCIRASRLDCYKYKSFVNPFLYKFIFQNLPKLGRYCLYNISLHI